MGFRTGFELKRDKRGYQNETKNSTRCRLECRRLVSRPSGVLEARLGASTKCIVSRQRRPVSQIDKENRQSYNEMECRTKGIKMKQIIQSLHTGTDAGKGFLLRQVKDQLQSKIRAKQELSPLETDLWDLINFEELSQNDRLALEQRLTKVSILSNGMINPKTAKDAGLGDVSNWILHLSPSDLSGVNICPNASAGCRAACLNGAGRGLFDGVQMPRLRKTLYFLKFRQTFLTRLSREIGKICAKTSNRVIVRLNGTSDLAWELFKVGDTGKNIFELYPNVTFYDYTKVFKRLERIVSIPNYHVTFSASESNWDDCLKALNLGVNVATVFRTSALPETYQGFKVIDGDKHDFRFLDARETVGLIVGLKAKGIAKRDTSGFVRDVGTVVH
jgi:hypothetical protein